MPKKFNLGINNSNSKKVPTVAKIESIFNINYEELEVSKEEKEMLQDVLMVCINDLLRKIDEEEQEMTKGMSIPGMGL